MPDPNLERLVATAEALRPLLGDLLLVGGCAAGLLVTDPGSSPIRPTLDVDLVSEAATYAAYHRVGERLRELGFQSGTLQGDPLCRWRIGELVVDVMPLDEGVLGFSNRWYVAATRKPLVVELPNGLSMRHIDAPHFLASKLEAFASRGAGDPVTSSDVEDIVVVVDGRSSIVREVGGAPEAVRSFVGQAVSALLTDRLFLEAMPGYFATEGDAAGRARIVLERLRHLVSR